MRTLEVAHHENLDVTLIGPNLPREARPFVEEYLQDDFTDVTATLENLQQLHQQRPFHGVITFWDRFVEMTARISTHLGLPGNSLETAQCTRNKFLMREKLQLHQIPRPKYQRVRSLEELRIAAEEVGFPFIFKPVGACSSKGIFKVKEGDCLETIFQQMQSSTDPTLDTMFAHYPKDYIVEEFMFGDEYSIEGVCQSGIAQIAGITEKWTTTDNFTESQHAFPARVEPAIKAEIESLTHSALAAIGYQNGAFHVEVMLTKTGPKIVEINGRLGGDFITTHLVQLGSGVEIIRESIRSALGMPIDLKAKSVAGSCVRFLIAEEEGVLSQWHGIEQGSKSENVKALFIEREVNMTVTLPPKKYGEFRLAAVITQGSDTSQAIQSARKAAALLRPEITPFNVVE